MDCSEGKSRLHPQVDVREREVCFTSERLHPQTPSEPLVPSGVQQLSLQLTTTACLPAAALRSARQAEASLLPGGAWSQHPPQVSQDQVLDAA